MDSRHSGKGVSPWRTTPPKAVAVFLLAVFFVFTTFGFVGDIMDMGHMPPLRYGVTVLFSGLFAVCYAAAGITLQRQFWKGLLPLILLQTGVMTLLAIWLPDVSRTVQTDAAEMGRLLIWAAETKGPWLKPLLSQLLQGPEGPCSLRVRMAAFLA